jgi:hypothetical protein
MKAILLALIVSLIIGCVSQENTLPDDNTQSQSICGDGILEYPEECDVNPHARRDTASIAGALPTGIWWMTARPNARA